MNRRASEVFDQAQVFTSPKKGYRIKVKLAVRGTVQKPLIGLFEKNSHRVTCSINHPSHHPKINQALLLLSKWITEQQVIPYQEGCQELPSQPLLKYLQLIYEEKSALCQLTLVWNSYEEKKLSSKINALEKSGLFQGIWVNEQPSSTNAIFGDQWHHVSGLPYVTQMILKNTFYFHPACFMQANPLLFEKVLVSIRDFLSKSLTDSNKKKASLQATEFYAGVGVIGLSLADFFSNLTCIEINPFAKECFSLHSKQAGKKSSIQFISGDSGLFTDHLKSSDVVVIDPPRKGMEKKMLYSLVAANVSCIITLYCGEEAFLRESKVFNEWGWKIEKMEFYDFFPGSDNFEILCIYSK